MFDPQDALKMGLHTVVSFVFLLIAQFTTVMNVDFMGTEGKPVAFGLHDSNKCSGDCGLVSAKNNLLSTASVCTQIALGITALTLLTDSGMLPGGNGKKLNPINNRGLVWALLLTKVLLLVIAVCCFASFAHSPDSFTLPGKCDVDHFAASNAPTKNDRFLSQTLGGILPSSTVTAASSVPTDPYNGITECPADVVTKNAATVAELSACYNSQLSLFVANKCKVVSNALPEASKETPMLQVFNTNNISADLSTGYMLIFFATGIAVAQLVTFLADHVIAPKGQRGGYVHRPGYRPVNRRRVSPGIV